MEAVEWLGHLLLQDPQRGADGDLDDGWVNLKEGVRLDCTLSVHDPEIRHGHESRHHQFDVHRAAVTVDSDSRLITALDVLSYIAWDSRGPCNR